jgi:hypothetical protein
MDVGPTVNEGTEGTDRTVGAPAESPGYFGDVNFGLIIVLVVMIIVIAVVGVKNRPPSTAPPTIPRDMAIKYQGASLYPKVTLTRGRDNGAVLTLWDISSGGTSVNPDQPAGTRLIAPYPGGPSKPVAWEIEIDNPSGARLCSPRYFADTSVGLSEPTPSLAIGSVAPPPPMTGHGVPAREFIWPKTSNDWLFVRLCWRSDGPLKIDGAYLSAQLPNMTWNSTTRVPASPQLTEYLNPGGSGTSTYSIQANPNPITTNSSWSWFSSNRPAPDTGGRAFDLGSVIFSAVNVATTQKENQNVFLSGVLLGIAGGALISVVTELAKPLAVWQKRQKRRRREPEHQPV